MGLEEALVVSFDQRSPHMFEVALEPSIQERSSAISSALGVILPWSSPTLKTSWPLSRPGCHPLLT